jgi:hypothetical protein
MGRRPLESHASLPRRSLEPCGSLARRAQGPAHEAAGAEEQGCAAVEALKAVGEAVEAVEVDPEAAARLAALRSLAAQRRQGPMPRQEACPTAAGHAQCEVGGAGEVVPGRVAAEAEAEAVLRAGGGPVALYALKGTAASASLVRCGRGKEEGERSGRGKERKERCAHMPVGAPLPHLSAAR